MIRSAGSSRLLVSTVIALAVVTAAFGAPQNSDQIKEGGQDLLKTAMLEAFKKSLGPGGEIIADTSGFLIDPLVTASTTPGSAEDKRDAWLLAMGQAGVSTAWPLYGLAISGGKIVIGGATYSVESLIEATRDQQNTAILFGRGAGGVLDRVNNVMSDTPFIDLPALRTRHITADSLGARITSEEELRKLWYKLYHQQLADLYGKREADNVINENWPRLLEIWRLQRAAAVVPNFVARLDAAAAEAIRDAKKKEANAQQVDASALPDISGTWKFNADWVYIIKQTGSNFTWSMAKFRENGEGELVGSGISAKWSGTNGSGSASGNVTVDAAGRATRIKWSNGVVFTRK